MLRILYKVAGGLQVDSSGDARWVLRVNNNWYPASSAVGVQSGAWYFMEIKYSTGGTASLWVNGGLVVSVSGQTLPSGAQIVRAGILMGIRQAVLLVIVTIALWVRVT